VLQGRWTGINQNSAPIDFDASSTVYQSDNDGYHHVAIGAWY
jgi:hypothetical protein